MPEANIEAGVSGGGTQWFQMAKTRHKISSLDFVI
jgi:hypothetical protein